ncbi:MAG TPA: GDSL-type esterase/lipase family protein [Draconibacterium sp.]|mgnify:CR=1 FL=1|nr:GDSL-type esterase/lipase family protein [Draconibacterium sp.]
MNQIKTNLIVFIFLLIATFHSNAQDPNRFKKDVDELAGKEYNFSNNQKLVVFAGSSSIRMWKDVQSYFPEYNVINNGFGGSQFSDLLYFYDALILKQKPEILFIYEGDNDINDQKKPGKILKEAKQLTVRIRKDLPETRIIFISPKPSIARVHLKNEYIKFNKKLNKYCKKQDNIGFADVWYPMLDSHGNVYKDVFLEDGLHMNKKGYDIWAKVIDEFLE